MIESNLYFSSWYQGLQIIDRILFAQTTKNVQQSMIVCGIFSRHGQENYDCIQNQTKQILMGIGDI